MQYRFEIASTSKLCGSWKRQEKRYHCFSGCYVDYFILHRQPLPTRVAKSSVLFMTLVATRDDVREFMSHHPEYVKANAYKDVTFRVYI